MKNTSSRYENIRRARKQKIFNRAVLVAAMVIIVVVTAYALSRPTSVVLPAYLSRCVPLTGTLAYSSSFELQILVNGANQTIPGGIGILGKTCIRPVHTFVGKTGPVTVYIDTDVNRTYTLKDFFLVWGSTFGPTWANFSSDQLFQLRADSSHAISMEVGNKTNTSFENYPLPMSGSALTNPRIVISYGSG